MKNLVASSGSCDKSSCHGNDCSKQSRGVEDGGRGSRGSRGRQGQCSSSNLNSERGGGGDKGGRGTGGSGNSGQSPSFMLVNIARLMTHTGRCKSGFLSDMAEANNCLFVGVEVEWHSTYKRTLLEMS